ADRHLTNARVLLADRKIAEAGVALEKARRIRPDHSGLAALDTQWRDELRRILAASTAIPKATKPEAKSTVAKVRDAIRQSIGADTPKAELLAVAAAPAVEEPAPSPSLAADSEIEELASAPAAGSAPDVQEEEAMTQ